MDILIGALAVVGGLALLNVAADRFVQGAAGLAVRFSVSAIVVGAVIVGFGTSLPEMVVSGLAAARGSLEIATANILGSNLANLTLVLGIASLIRATTATRRVVTVELPLAAAATVAIAIAVQGGLSRPEGVALLAGMGLALVLMLRAAPESLPVEEELTEELTAHSPIIERASVDAEHHVHGEVRLRPAVLNTVGGLIGVVAGAQALVWGAQGLAAAFGLGEGLVGMTLVALGTSAPELATGIQSARRGHADLLVGNVLGSNVFNALAVGGVAALAGPGSLTGTDLTVMATGAMLVATVVAGGLLVTRRRVGRVAAGVLVALWIASVPLVA